jgi:hypothetical protein
MYGHVAYCSALPRAAPLPRERYKYVVLLSMSSSTAESNSTRLALFIFYIRDWKPIYLKDTAQMTGGDVTLNILDTFFTCVQYLEFIQLGVDFIPNFDSWYLRLQETKHRFHRWGVAAGITDAQSKDFRNQLAARPNVRDVRKIWCAVRMMAIQLSKAKGDSQYHLEKSQLEMSDDLQRLEIIDAFEQMKISDSPKAKQAYSASEKLGSEYQSIPRTAAKTSNPGKWTLYKPEALSELLRDIRKHLECLESFYPKELYALAAREARDLDPEAMEALLLFTQGSDPIVADELRPRALQTYGVWENTYSSDNAIVHLGHNRKTRPDDRDGGRWSNTISSGRADVHCGHNYD